MIKKSKVFLVGYYIFGCGFPPSNVSVISKKIRCFWAKKILKKYGNNINIEKGAIFNSKTSIGNNSSIGLDCKIYGEVNIGNDVMMGPNVGIFAQNHNYYRTDIPIRKQGYTGYPPITIDDDVWIGYGVIILPGVHIGKGTIIGAGTIVTKDIPPYSIFVGNNENVIKKRMSIEEGKIIG